MIDVLVAPPQEESEQIGTSRPVGQSSSSSLQGQPAESPSWHQPSFPPQSEQFSVTLSGHGDLGFGVPGGGTGNPGGGKGNGMIGGLGPPPLLGSLVTSKSPSRLGWSEEVVALATWGPCKTRSSPSKCALNTPVGHSPRCA